MATAENSLSRGCFVFHADRRTAPTPIMASNTSETATTCCLQTGDRRAGNFDAGIVTTVAGPTFRTPRDKGSKSQGCPLAYSDIALQTSNFEHSNTRVRNVRLARQARRVGSQSPKNVQTALHFCFDRATSLMAIAGGFILCRRCPKMSPNVPVFKRSFLVAEVPLGSRDLLFVPLGSRDLPQRSWRGRRCPQMSALANDRFGRPNFRSRRPSVNFALFLQS